VLLLSLCPPLITCCGLEYWIHKIIWSAGQYHIERRETNLREM
jgi:hypothetical protein